ncbi:MAG: Hsp20 family protein [Alphaproteobacteria bacterium]|nr:Hsp20 family protein [Alphaproteobacteria bacterium]
MRTYDLSPMLRSSVGFDRMSRLLDSALSAEPPAYPPYNIERTGEDGYQISVAVAGFGEDELDVTVKDGVLIITGKKADGEDKNFLHRGIAQRAFTLRFQLADHIEVRNADLSNGLLNIALVREVPEAMKPKTIQITRGKAKVIEGKKAA